MSGDAGNAAEILGVERRKALLGLGLAALLSLAAVALLGQLTSWGELLQALREARKWWLPLTLVGQVVAFAGYVVAYRDVAAVDGGPRLTHWQAGRVVGLGLGAYVVASAAGGLTVDYWALHRAGAGTHEAARRTLALNTLQGAALASFAVLAAVFVLALGPPGHTATVMAIVWLTVVPAAVAAAAYVSGEGRAQRFTSAPDDEERPSGLGLLAWAHWLKAKLRKALADAIGGVVFVRQVLAHPLRHRGGIVGYPLFWLGDFATLYVALRAFGVELGPHELVLAEASAWALTFVPLPAGGSGAAETAMTFSLHAVGVPLSHAIFAALTYRAVNFWLPILPALALLTQVPELQEELPEVERAPEEEDARLHQQG